MLRHTGRHSEHEIEHARRQAGIGEATGDYLDEQVPGVSSDASMIIAQHSRPRAPRRTCAPASTWRESHGVNAATIPPAPRTTSWRVPFTRPGTMRP